MTASFARSAVVVFIASFCTLVIEIVAGRLMAPYVGVSLYTWTSIIGVVLAGISAGAWAGGALADRRPVASTLGILLLLSGVASMLIAPLVDALGADNGLLNSWSIGLTLVSRVVILAFALFFLPSFLLGMISPVAVKLAVRRLEDTGKIVGALYAISTAGSIAGTFVTGFYLIARHGTRATLIGVGVSLIASALVLGGFGRASAAAGMSGIAILSVWRFLHPPVLPPPPGTIVMTHDLGAVHRKESQYYTIEVAGAVRADTGAPLLALNLDHLTHSYYDPNDPKHMEYGYLRIFNEVVRWKATAKPDFRMMFLGGGGYTLPRITEQAWPRASIDVIEIDPAVTAAARNFLGVPRDTRIRTFNEDARWHVMRSRRTYDAIFIDVFNDMSVPYHLTTRELTEELDRLLEWDGVIVVNVIDNYARGEFLPSYIRTLQSVSGADNVALILESPSDASDIASTYVVVASPVLPQLIDALHSSTSFDGYVVPATELRKYLQSSRGIVLRDDFAPVDNMLAARFAERFASDLE